MRDVSCTGRLARHYNAIDSLNAAVNECNRLLSCRCIVNYHGNRYYSLRKSTATHPFFGATTWVINWIFIAYKYFYEIRFKDVPNYKHSNLYLIFDVLEIVYHLRYHIRKNLNIPFIFLFVGKTMRISLLQSECLVANSYDSFNDLSMYKNKAFCNDQSSPSTTLSIHTFIVA